MINQHFSFFFDKSRLYKIFRAELNKLDMNELKSIGNDLCDALTTKGSKYRGICKERHTFFRSEEYGKTSLWQELMTEIQSILKTESASNDPVMKISISRWS